MNYLNQFLFGYYPYIALAVFFLGVDSLFGWIMTMLLDLA